ncbi:MAG: cytochrome c3 family protein [Desulfobacula sp.]|nr:cytochrome c3 family protein [Desulfobacula sp.]
MELKKLFIILFCSTGIFFSFYALCFGLDENGCLFCHKYPGMVRFEQSNVMHGQQSEKTVRLKILHIDEEEFSGSTHGEMDCKQCHATINSVPHTGESRVDCTTACHTEDEEKKMIKDYSLSGFHENEQSYIVSLNDKSSCRVCHLPYPHNDNQVVRAFLNMHTGFMQCRVCHIKKNKYKNIVYKWEESQNVHFFGKPFGTYYKPETKKTIKNKTTISRIAVHSSDLEGEIRLADKAGIKKAGIFIKNKGKMSQDDIESSLVFFHRDIEKNEISVACGKCHSTNGIMDFKKLGFDAKKTNNLTTINIKGLVVKYKTFYFPNLFE